MATTNIQTFPGDVTVTSNLTVNTNTLHVDSVSGRVGLGTTLPTKTLDVVGTGKTSSNLTVGTDAFHVDTVNSRIGIGTTNSNFVTHGIHMKCVCVNHEIRSHFNIP
jgi:hypothetical protein